MLGGMLSSVIDQMPVAGSFVSFSCVLAGIQSPDRVTLEACGARMRKAVRWPVSGSGETSVSGAGGACCASAANGHRKARRWAGFIEVERFTFRGAWYV